jgi:hypothetical protein
MGGALTAPVVYLDRVLYDPAGGPGARSEAAALLARQEALCMATGLSSHGPHRHSDAA